jgi:TRAP-type mannitol/chloroaromatic compound transport system substrate-binding protein
MKKKLAILTGVILILALVVGMLPSCKAAPTTPTTPTTTTPTTPEPTKPAPVAEGVTLQSRCQSNVAAGTSTYPYFVEIFDNVEVMTQGRWKIDPLPAGAIVGSFEVYDAVQSGTLEMARSTDTTMQSKDIAFAFLGQIGAHFTWDQLMIWNYGDQFKGREKENEFWAPFNIHWIPMSSGHTEAEYVANKEILVPSDMKGLKIRGLGWSAKMWNEPEFGASGVQMPASDVYTALERGVIDAAELGNPESNWKQGLHEVTKYQGFPGIHNLCQTNGLIINMDFWNDLPDDFKKCLEMACAYNHFRELALNAGGSAYRLQEFIDYGGVIVETTPEYQRTMRDVSWRLADEVAADNPKVKVLWDDMKEFMRVVGYYLALQTPNYGDD